MNQFPRVIIATSLLGLGACIDGSAGDDGRSGTSVGTTTEASRAALVGGSDSPATQNQVVAVLSPLGGGQVFLCTGAMVAPNLVLFARHCVSRTGGGIGCAADGSPLGNGGDFGPTVTATSVEVHVGPASPASLAEPTPAATGKKLFLNAGSNVCDGDLALLLLAADIPGAKIAPLRLDKPPVANEPVTAIGYGQISSSTMASTRQTRDSTVGGVGPTTLSLPIGDLGLPEGTFSLTGAFMCQGDSGGPLLAKSTEAIIGVTSYASSVCGSNQFTVYRSIQQSRALILSAFAESGYDPVLEPGSAPAVSDAGADDDEAPSTKKDAGKSKETATAAAPQDSAGCSAAPRTTQGSWPLILAAALLLSGVRRRTSQR